MRGRRGMIWLAVAFGLISLMLPLPGTAAEPDVFRVPAWRLPVLPTASQTPLEAQMLGEKPFQAQPSRRPDAFTNIPGMALEDDGAILRLPMNLEMRVSFLYNREPSLESKARGDSYLLFKYSMDYHLLPNLQVGLNGYLYHPKDETFTFQRQFGDKVMGLGPQLKYDLGRWSFLLKSQYESGNRERGEGGLQNWFRVWYAF